MLIILLKFLLIFGKTFVFTSLKIDVQYEHKNKKKGTAKSQRAKKIKPLRSLRLCGKKNAPQSRKGRKE